MAFARDPLSAQFDRQAALTITLAIQQKTRYAVNTRLVPYIRVRVPNPPGAPPIRETRAAQLSRHERAFTRALYYDGRIANANRRFHPDAEWSLKLTWGAVPVLPGGQRYVTIEVFPDTEGARYAEDRLSPDQKFVESGPNRGGVGVLG